MCGQHYCTCAFCPRQLSPFYPLSTCHVRYFRAQALCYPKPRGSKVAHNNRSSRGPGNEAIAVVHWLKEDVTLEWHLWRGVSTVAKESATCNQSSRVSIPNDRSHIHVYACSCLALNVEHMKAREGPELICCSSNVVEQG